ncbi:DEAD/DEAH box helicase [Pelistega sp. NLN82]|uniref:DEAD/DEAH box helicase n=1 Tax=Pelistega ratti TaxID=2652177 RepID=A0A6L9Y7L7_9BURK|nr:DEAD/DEAH box helicase [Pelistega ratti]NEN75794.1 DEAD/DEAH box helicase [Pelistega ratti]
MGKCGRFRCRFGRIGKTVDEVDRLFTDFVEQIVKERIISMCVNDIQSS